MQETFLHRALKRLKTRLISTMMQEIKARRFAVNDSRAQNSSTVSCSSVVEKFARSSRESNLPMHLLKQLGACSLDGE